MPRKISKEDQTLLSNSVERLINWTVGYLEKHTGGEVQEILDEWEYMKWPAVHAWNDARNQAFIRANAPEEPTDAAQS